MKRFKRILITILLKLMYLGWLAAGTINLIIAAITYNMIPMIFNLALILTSEIVLVRAMCGLFYENADSLIGYISSLTEKDKPEDKAEPVIENINLEHNYTSDFTLLNQMIEEKKQKNEQLH